MSMRIAVLGATGVYGRHLVPRLIAAGYGVRALVRRPEARRVDVRVRRRENRSSTTRRACADAVVPSDESSRARLAVMGARVSRSSCWLGAVSWSER